MDNFENSLDLTVFGDLSDTEARSYIEAKYGIETRQLADKALSRFDAMQDLESGHNLGAFPFGYTKKSV